MIKEIVTARLKLTFFYMLIVMCISVFFSMGVYKILNNELQRGLRAQVLKAIPTENGPIFIKHIPEYEAEIFEEARQRIIYQLFVVNIGILVLTGFAGYFLSGKTLQPIEAAMEDQKRFISDASHELRTPLTALKTEIEVALRDNKITLNQAKDLLKSNLEEVDKMQSLSNYLLSLTKYQNGTKQSVSTKIDLAKISKNAIDNINKKHITNVVKIKSDLKEVFVHGNVTALTELLSILIDNAVKYSGTSKTVHVKTYKRNDGHKIFEVIDFGIGIKASDLPYIFNRFYRADISRAKEHIDGYGLGLSIAKSIADIHNAQITVKSTPEKGSTFKVIFK